MLTRDEQRLLAMPFEQPVGFRFGIVRHRPAPPTNAVADVSDFALARPIFCWSGKDRIVSLREFQERHSRPMLAFVARIEAEFLKDLNREILVYRQFLSPVNDCEASYG